MKRRNQIYAKLAYQLGGDPEFCNLLATAASESDRKAVTAALRRCLVDLNEPALLPPSIPLYRDFLAYCHRNLGDLPSLGLTSAVLGNALHSKKLRGNRNLFVFTLGLNWKAKAQHDRREAAIAAIPRISVAQRTEPYPPLNSLVAESPEIYTLWEHSVKFGKQPDKRQGRPNILLLKKHLVSTIGPGQSAFLVDEEGRLCGIVWRDFVSQPSVLEDLVAIGKESAETRTSIRVRLTSFVRYSTEQFHCRKWTQV